MYMYEYMLFVLLGVSCSLIQMCMDICARFSLYMYIDLSVFYSVGLVIWGIMHCIIPGIAFPIVQCLMLILC